MYSTEEFVVSVQVHRVWRARRRMLAAMAISAWISVASGAAIAGLTVMLLLIAGPIGLLNMVPALALGVSGAHSLRRVDRTRSTWARQGAAPVAMRITRAGLRVNIDAAPDPIVLPWSAVNGFRLVTRLRQQMLVLALAPGVGPGSPGVTGLEHPSAQQMLNQRTCGVRGLWIAVRVLHQPIEIIDHALASYSDGRVRIHPTNSGQHSLGPLWDFTKIG